MEYCSLSKSALGVLRVNAAIQGFVLTAIAAVVSGVLVYNGIIVFTVAAIITGAAVLTAAAYVLFVPPLRHRRYKYLISPDRVEIIEGLFFVRRTIVPIDRIHQIDIAKGPIDNAFGVAKVIVTTAGSTAVMRFLENEKADTIALELNTAVRGKIRGREDV